MFCSRNLGYQGINVLSQALQTNTNLTALDLSSNQLGSEGARCVANLLVHQSMANAGNKRGGVKSLILADNFIRDDGVRSIARALELNDILESLWIDDNCIGAVGLQVLGDSLSRNSTLERLHLKHNSFQSLKPLLHCTFNKRSLESVANSNHTLKHVFLNCGYEYESEELQTILKINRLGKGKARRMKIGLYLAEDLNRLYSMDIGNVLLPRVLSILGETGDLSSMHSVLQNLSSEVLLYQRCNTDDNVEFADDAMDVEYL